MAPTYRIRDWNTHFETAESRKLQKCRWLPLPNRHDGKGYRRLSRHPNAVEVYCAWCLILQVASKCPIRGTLADENGPLAPVDFADATGFDESLFALALTILSQPAIGWIETVNMGAIPDAPRKSPESGGSDTVSGGSATNPPDEPQTNGGKAPNPPDDREKHAEIPRDPPDVWRKDPKNPAEGRQAGKQGEEDHRVSGARETDTPPADNATRPWNPDFEAEEDSVRYSDDPPVVAIRAIVYQGLKRWGLPDFMNPVNLEELLRLAVLHGAGEVVEAMRITTETTKPSVPTSTAFVAYVAKVLATRAFDRNQQANRNPIYTRENPPPRATGASPVPRPMSSLFKTPNNKPNP